MINTLLIPLDGSASTERALPYAVQLARWTHSRLLLMHAGGDLAHLARIEAEFGIVVRLEPHLDALRRMGTTSTPGTAVGSLSSPAILRVAQEEHVDLIVMSIQGHISDKLLQWGEEPVLLVSPACDRRWQDDRPFRLLVPLDGSVDSESALPLARGLAESICADLLLVRAIQERSDGSHSIRDEVGDNLDEVRQSLDAIAGEQRTTYRSISRLVNIGDAASVIVNAARQENIDLIVMATRGRTYLRRLAVESVADQVLQRANTPILLLRPTHLSQRAASTLGGADLQHVQARRSPRACTNVVTLIREQSNAAGRTD